MKMGSLSHLVKTACLFAIIAMFITSTNASLASESHIIVSTGSVVSGLQVDVAVSMKVIGVNNLSLGFQLDHMSWLGFRDYPVRRKLAPSAFR